MMLLKSIRGFSSHRSLVWLACVPVALLGLGLFTFAAKAEELPELNAAFLANNLWLLVAVHRDAVLMVANLSVAI